MIKGFFERLKANWGFLSTALLICLGLAFLIWQYTVTTGSFSKFISEWQTLITGLIALLGVLLTVWQIQKTQIESRESKLKRALIYLPNTLADICQYASSSILIIEKDCSGEKPNSDFPLKLPDGVLDTLAGIAEVSEEAERTAIRNLIDNYQVCYSRCNSLYASGVEPLIGKRDRYRMLCDFVDLHSFATRLFSFARERKYKMFLNAVSSGEHEKTMSSVFQRQHMQTPGSRIEDKPDFKDYEKTRYEA